MTKKMTEKNTKTEILDALKEAQDKINEMKSVKVDLEQEVKEKKKVEVVEKAESFSISSIMSMARNLNDDIKKVSDSLDTYHEIKAAIDVKNNELKELLGIEKEAYSLAALVNAQSDLKERVDAEVSEKRKIAEEEYKAAKEEAKKLLTDTKDKLAQEEKETKQRRDREEEAWRYTFDRHKTIEKNNFIDEINNDQRAKEAEWREIETKHIARENALNARELTIKQNEDLVTSLNNQVLEFPAKLAEAIKTAEDDGRKKAAQAFGYEKSLMLKDCERQVDVLANKNETLTTQLEDANTRISTLSQKLDEAYARIEMMATKTVEGASNAKIISTLEGALKDKTVGTKA